MHPPTKWANFFYCASTLLQCPCCIGGGGTTGKWGHSAPTFNTCRLGVFV